MLYRKYKIQFLVILSLATLGASFSLLFRVTHASYVESNLIADSVMLDAASMGYGPNQIQSFLVEKKSYLASYTPFSGRDNANVPASQIIYEAASDYGINPKAILATLQKEQSLVTDQSPSQSQLDHAMGYGCPDGSQCNAKYYGFYNQVDNATWQLRFDMERVLGNNAWWNSTLTYPCNGPTRYYSAALRTGNSVTFYDNYGTAYKTFTLQNAATSALYCYTPHAYPGSKAQYYSGSYNFVTSYESWFGSTQPGVVVDSSVTAGPSSNFFTGLPVTVTVRFKNNTGSPIDIGTFTIAVRDQSQNNYDFPLQKIVVPAYSTATYQQTETFNQAGTYTYDIGDYRDGYGWRNDYPVSSVDLYQRSGSFQIQAQPMVTAGLTLSPSNPRVGQNYTASFIVTNNDASTVNVGTLLSAIRDSNGVNWDLPLDSNVSIAAGQTYTYTKTGQFSQPGNYTFSIANWRPDVGWNSTFPASADNTIVRSLSITVLPSPTIITGLTSSRANPHVGQTTTLSFQVKNYGSSAIQPGRVGLAIRDPQGVNQDPWWDTPTINPDQTYTYSVNVPFDKVGNWTVEIGNYQSSVGWNNTLPVSETSQIVRKLVIRVEPSVTITSGLAVSVAQPRVGQQISVTFTATNFSSSSADLGRLGVAVRDSKNNNLDIGYDSVTLAGNSTYTLNKTVTFNSADTMRMTIANYQSSVGWNGTLPASDSGDIIRSLTLTVLPSPTIVTSLTSSLANPQVGQMTTLSFQVENYGSSAIQPGKLGLAIRDPQGRNYDPWWDTPTINPDQTYTYSVNVPFDKVGNWTVEIGNYQSSVGWNNTLPVSETSQIVRKLVINVAN